MTSWVQREVEMLASYTPGTPAHESMSASMQRLYPESRACSRDTDGDGHCAAWRTCLWCRYIRAQDAYLDRQEHLDAGRRVVLDAFPFTGDRLIEGGFLGC